MLKTDAAAIKADSFYGSNRDDFVSPSVYFDACNWCSRVVGATIASSVESSVYASIRLALNQSKDINKGSMESALRSLWQLYDRE